MATEKPTHEVMVATLQGKETGWTYRFHVPPVTHDKWTHDDWIRHIGDNWYRRTRRETP